MNWQRGLPFMILLMLAGKTCASRNNLQRLSRAHFEFSLHLYRSLVTDAAPEENVMFSPSSLTSVLSMLFLGAGADSNTSAQLRNVLRYTNLSFLDVHKTFKSVLAIFEEPYYSSILALANGVFKQTGVSLSHDYKKALTEYYNSDLWDVDFTGEEEARETINNWISAKTEGKITDLLTEPLSSQSKIMIVNALVLKAAWLHKFDERQTFDKGLFYETDKKRFEIPMMIGKFKLPLGCSPYLECRVLEMPFEERRISLFILLPDDIEKGLANLEGNLTSENIKSLFSTLKDEIVNIRLPRFSAEYRSNMIPALQKMGVHDLFSAKLANLTGISEDPANLHVSAIAHKTVLEIREKGADASAATTSSVERVGNFGEKYFEVDHAFLFFIWDYHSGSVLFMGRIVNPTPLMK